MMLPIRLRAVRYGATSPTSCFRVRHLYKDLSRRSAKRVGGFTLVELLIVLFIISIVTTTALLSIRHNENKQLEAIAGEISGRIKLAESQAMLMPAVIGLTFDGQSLQFVQYEEIADGKKNKKPAWVDYDDNVLTGFVIPDGAIVELKIKNAEEKDDQLEEKKEESTIKPAIIISTNGDITPFTITIAANGKKPKYIITGNENGAIISQAVD